MSEKENNKHNFTDEQKKYIEYKGDEDTKLLACAGSGKTKCIIARIDNILSDKTIDSESVLMLTFSRFTRDDFLNKIDSYGAKNIDKKSVKTIDSFAKSLIDNNNEIDVSLLSLRFMKYLANETAENLKKNDKLAVIRELFIDEAQDLNEIQYKICVYMKEKLGVKINLIGDPNQNIYQFRNSSDKYLTEFNAKTFYLTKNFRSCKPIVEFSKYLRPYSTMDVEHTKEDNGLKPYLIFHHNEEKFERELIGLLNNAKKSGIDLSEFAILAPTRGKMRGHNRSHGLCFVTNVLYRADIKFKQFYEESMDDSGTKIAYKPEKDHVNILTYMGSKGLEWNYVIVIDADICLINKRYFDEDKHKADQYLLYVACSRAIQNMFIFSHVSTDTQTPLYRTNPWFKTIPKELFIVDNVYTKKINYPQLKYNNPTDSEKNISKIIDKMDEHRLDKLSDLLEYGFSNSLGYKKDIIKIYDSDFSELNYDSSIFLGKYIKNLYFCYINIKNGKQHKKYIDIENIIDNNKCVLKDVPYKVSEWYLSNRKNLTWEIYDSKKHELDNIITDYVDKYFIRECKINEHTMVNDNYYSWYVIKKREWLKKIYNRYINCNDASKMKERLFYVMVVLHAFDTQHYYHIREKGRKFTYLLDLFDNMINKIKTFAFSADLNFVNNNLSVSKYNMSGDIDLLDSDNKQWEIKCTSDISLRHILQSLMNNILHNDLVNNFGINNITLNFINFLKGEIVKINLVLDDKKILSIVDEFLDCGKLNVQDAAKLA